MLFLNSCSGQVQLQIEYGSQHGQVQINVMEINSLILPAGTCCTVSHCSVLLLLFSIFLQCKGKLPNDVCVNPFNSLVTVKGYGNIN